LIELAGEEPEVASLCRRERSLISFAVSGDAKGLTAALAAEEKLERERDRLYWTPRKAELERLRHRTI